VDTAESFDVVAKTHKRRGFFFSDELKDRGIIGEFAGATRKWKLNYLWPKLGADKVYGRIVPGYSGQAWIEH
jgi:Cys-tRNA synthase (O-phospho-L-seryl-tRNA:Cys-tRNA synthase)